MKRMLLFGLLAISCLIPTACGSSGGDASSSGTNAQEAEFSRINTPEPTPTTDPNDAACSDVQDLLTGSIRDTFNTYDPQTNEFDKQVATELRDGATKLYAVQRKSSGAVSDAIAAEAKGLTDLSIAIEQEDDAAVGEASNSANSALAALQGVCDF